MLRLPLRLVALAAALVLLAGCGKHITAAVPPAPAAPASASPVDAVLRLQWCWNNRDTTGLQDLFTSDYAFVFQAYDTSITHAALWQRSEELQSSRNLFVNGSNLEPPASQVELTFDPHLAAVADTSSGRDSVCHRQILTAFTLRTLSMPSSFYVRGNVRFFLVRGDSARIPHELTERDYVANPTQWWIERWEDLVTAGPRASAAQPSKIMTLGVVKALYLPDRAAIAPATQLRAARRNPRRSPG